jgi:thiol-disulfide isomerase/thioredoxin
MRLILSLIFLFALCFSSVAQETTDSVETRPEKNAEPAFESLGLGEKANPITGEDADGKELPTLNLADGKVYLLDFWFARCPPCIASIPKLIELQNSFGKMGFSVIGVNSFDLLTDDLNNHYHLLSEPRDKVKQLIEDHGINYPLYFTNIAVDQSYLVKAYPTLYLVKNGSILFSHLGFDEAGMDELEQAIQKALMPQD